MVTKSCLVSLGLNFVSGLFNIVFDIIEFGDGIDETPVEKGDDKGRHGEHEVSFGHVEFSFLFEHRHVVSFSDGLFKDFKVVEEQTMGAYL